MIETIKRASRYWIEHPLEFVGDVLASIVIFAALIAGLWISPVWM